MEAVTGKISKAIEEKSGIQLAEPEMSEVIIEIPDDLTKKNLPDVVRSFKSQISANVETDYDFARKNLSAMISKGMTAIDGAISLAKEAESPRVYEATAAFLKTLSDLNKDLLELSKSIEATEKKSEGGQPLTVTNNSVFVGSSEDLASMIQARIKESLVNRLPSQHQDNVVDIEKSTHTSHTLDAD